MRPPPSRRRPVRALSLSASAAHPTMPRPQRTVRTITPRTAPSTKRLSPMPDWVQVPERALREEISRILWGISSSSAGTAALRMVETTLAAAAAAQAVRMARETWGSRLLVAQHREVTVVVETRVAAARAAITPPVVRAETADRGWIMRLAAAEAAAVIRLVRVALAANRVVAVAAKILLSRTSEVAVKSN